jgi:hypothetical protein
MFHAFAPGRWAPVFVHDITDADAIPRLSPAVIRSLRDGHGATDFNFDAMRLTVVP